MNEIENFEPAYNRMLIKLEKQGYVVDHVKFINQMRYLIVFGYLNGLEHNLLITFKREFFLSYGKILQEFGAKGIGESLNIDDIRYAAQFDIKTIFFIYPTAQAYSISWNDFLTNSHKWINKENKEVRSISIHELKSEGKI